MLRASAPASPPSVPTPEAYRELPTVALGKTSPRALSPTAAEPAAAAPSSVRPESIDDSFDPEATVAETSQGGQDALARIFATSLPGLGAPSATSGDAGGAAAKSPPGPAPFGQGRPADDPDGELPTIAGQAAPKVSVAPAPEAPATAPASSASVPGSVSPAPPTSPAAIAGLSPTPPRGARVSAPPPTPPARPRIPQAVSPAEAPETTGEPPAGSAAPPVATPPVATPPVAAPPPVATPPPAPSGATRPAGFLVTHTPSPFEATGTGDSGVYTKTVADERAAVSERDAPAASGPAFGRAPSPDVYTRTVADAQAIVAPSMGGPAAPRATTPAPGRPSDMLPRPPASAVVRGDAPGPWQNGQAAGGRQAPAPSIAVMPSAYALPGHTPPPVPGADTAPDAYSSTPAPGGYPQASPPGRYPQAPPPAGYGPPPPMHDASYPSAALDSLAGGNDRADSSANAVWRQAHPSASRWAASRTGKPAITPRPGIIALGLMLAGLGAYLLLIFLPSKAPLTAAARAEQLQQAGVDENAWHFTSQLMSVATVNAGLFVLLGVVVLLQGALHRQGPTRRKTISKTSLLLLSCFGVLAITFVALLLSASIS